MKCKDSFHFSQGGGGLGVPPGGLGQICCESRHTLPGKYWYQKNCPGKPFRDIAHTSVDVSLENAEHFQLRICTSPHAPQKCISKFCLDVAAAITGRTFSYIHVYIIYTGTILKFASTFLRGTEFTDFNLGFHESTFLYTTLKCTDYFKIIPHNNRNTSQRREYITATGIPHKDRDTSQRQEYLTKTGIPKEKTGIPHKDRNTSTTGIPHRDRNTSQGQGYLTKTRIPWAQRHEYLEHKNMNTSQGQGDLE